ncbi:hypothetical protein ACFU5O_17200 [Streptomyces sp. NPDC057445]|uniref:hypothetical protein n=1 Tax=Streptomyces sp. NPDC057445 TaxID=3346136 RepID=UPI0036778AA3
MPRYSIPPQSAGTPEVLVVPGLGLRRPGPLGEWVEAPAQQPSATPCNRPGGIADAALAVGASERTLQRALDRVLGISPLRFAQRIRLDQ